MTIYLILPMAVLGPVPTTIALALPAVTTVPCNENTSTGVHMHITIHRRSEVLQQTDAT